MVNNRKMINGVHYISKRKRRNEIPLNKDLVCSYIKDRSNSKATSSNIWRASKICGEKNWSLFFLTFAAHSSLLLNCSKRL